MVDALRIGMLLSDSKAEKQVREIVDRLLQIYRVRPELRQKVRQGQHTEHKEIVDLFAAMENFTKDITDEKACDTFDSHCIQLYKLVDGQPRRIDNSENIEESKIIRLLDIGNNTYELLVDVPEHPSVAPSSFTSKCLMPPAPRRVQ